MEAVRNVEAKVESVRDRWKLFVMSRTFYVFVAEMAISAAGIIASFASLLNLQSTVIFYHIVEFTFGISLGIDLILRGFDMIPRMPVYMRSSLFYICSSAAAFIFLMIASLLYFTQANAHIALTLSGVASLLNALIRLGLLGYFAFFRIKERKEIVYGSYIYNTVHPAV